MIFESNSLFHNNPTNQNHCLELSVIIPTFNERENIALLVNRLHNALKNVYWEALFIDDNSPDGTAQFIREISQQDNRIRCIRRIGRRGLAGACLEGILASHARYIAIMDADLQHDETKLLPMLEQLRSHTIDLIVATRYALGGNATSFSPFRSYISRCSTAMTQLFLGVTLSDPMSGFFMIRRDIVDNMASSLSTQGFKILLDVITTSKDTLRIAEIPFSFGKRKHGESKFSLRIALNFVSLLIKKLIKRL